jgi:hypothetical protein
MYICVYRRTGGTWWYRGHKNCKSSNPAAVSKTGSAFLALYSSFPPFRLSSDCSIVHLGIGEVGSRPSPSVRPPLASSTEICAQLHSHDRGMGGSNVRYNPGQYRSAPRLELPSPRSCHSSRPSVLLLCRSYVVCHPVSLVSVDGRGHAFYCIQPATTSHQCSLPCR